MSSSHGPRSEPSTTNTIITTTESAPPTAATTTTTTTTNTTTAPTVPDTTNSSKQIDAPTTIKIPGIVAREPPAILNPTEHATNDDEATNLSEAETVVLGGSNDEAHSSKELPHENGRRRERARERGREGRGRRGRERLDEENPRKRRRRSVSTSLVRGKDASDEWRPPPGDDIDDDDAEYSSDLSSATSSRHVSPVRRRTRQSPRSFPQHIPSQRHANSTRKRKVPTTDGTTTSSDDEPPTEPEPRPRRRRNSAFESSPRTRKASLRSSSPHPPDSRLSPTIITKTRASQTGSKKQRKVPPPLITSRESDDESSSSLSRQGSPARRRRIPTSARTPGSPVNMNSHKPKRDTAGRTQLHRASQRGALDDVKALLAKGVDFLNAEDNAGYMPIHEASLNGHLEVVKVLVEHGAQFDTRSSVELESPLLDAVENGHVPVVKYLLSLGADPRHRDRQGRNCLDANREGDNEEVRDEIEKLLKAAIKQRPAQRPSDDENNRVSVPADRDSPSSRDPSVASPAHHSPPAPAQNNRRRNARAEQSRKDLLWLDSGRGSVIKLRDKAREGDIQMVHALLETGLRPDTEALIGAIRGGHAELVSLLLAYAAEADPEPGALDKEGGRRKRDVSMPAGEETPMLAAIGRGNVTILRYLLENGADPLRRDSKGRTYPEIAKEREGEYWQEEVQLLQEAWQKALPSDTKSPSRRKSSPKPKSATKRTRRNSSSSASKSQNPPSDKTAKRSVSANPPLSEIQDVSESDAAEPLAPPKNRVGRPKRSESESLTPGVAKKRRRLVSGKVRDQEAARVEPMLPVSERDSDEGKMADRMLDEPLSNPITSIADDSRTEPASKKPKLEPSEDVRMEDAPPSRPKSKAPSLHERQPSVARSDTAARESKRPTSRTRSPPKAPRSDRERQEQEDKLRKRRREEYASDDRYSRRPDLTAEDSIRVRDGRPEARPDVRPGKSRPTSVSSEPSQNRDDSRRAPNRAEAEFRQTEDEVRRRQRDKERAKKDEDERDLRERKEKKLKEEKLVQERDKEKEKEKEKEKGTDPVQVQDKEKGGEKEKQKVKEKEKRPPVSVMEIDQEQINLEARELIRKRHLTKELASIQKKAEKERADEVITRELEARRIREEEAQRQRILREQADPEQEEKDAREKMGSETREKEDKEKEELESVAKAEERTRTVREARDKAAQEMDEKERLAKEKAERERKDMETKEREEREQREKREATERETRLREERQRESERKLEEERNRTQELRSKIAVDTEESRKKEETEKRTEHERLEQQRSAEEAEERRKAAEEEAKLRDIEKAKVEKEVRDRKTAEDLQQQITQETEARRMAQDRQQASEMARIQSLPYTLRIAAENQIRGVALEDYRNFIPLFTATFPGISRSTITTNGSAHRRERWVLNVQAALALETNDLPMRGFSITERRVATEHERMRMWSVLAPMLCESVTQWSTSSLEERKASQFRERNKFLTMMPVFWIKYDDVLTIISSDPRYKHRQQHPISTIDVTLDFPTNGKGSPRFDVLPGSDDLAVSIKRKFNAQTSTSISTSPSQSMPPPQFGSFSSNS